MFYCSSCIIIDLLNSHFFSDSAMFLFTGSSRSSLSSLRSEIRTSELAMNGTFSSGANGSSHSRSIDIPIKMGNVAAYDSLINLLDCCILYYYAVAHKYIIMVSVLQAF